MPYFLIPNLIAPVSSLYPGCIIEHLSVNSTKNTSTPGNTRAADRPRAILHVVSVESWKPQVKPQKHVVDDRKGKRNSQWPPPRSAGPAHLKVSSAEAFDILEQQATGRLG